MALGMGTWRLRKLAKIDIRSVRNYPIARYICCIEVGVFTNCTAIITSSFGGKLRYPSNLNSSFCTVIERGDILASFSPPLEHLKFF